MTRAASDVSDASDATQPEDIEWKPFDGNMVMSTRPDGVVAFERTILKEHDVALGQAFTTGVHEWIVTAPNWHPNNYVGVASRYVDKRIYPAGSFAYAMYLHDGTLCSGAASHPAQGGQAFGVGSQKAVKSKHWPKDLLISTGTPICVILDMDQRTLSFAIGDAQPQVAFTGLPAGMHPYVCSGEKAERSQLVVSGPPAADIPTGINPTPAKQGRWW